MQIDKLLIRDFRCHREFLSDLSPGFNVFLGANAQGKTSILEAVYYLASFASFRTLKPQELIRHGCTSALVAAKAGEKSLRVTLSNEGRSCSLDRKKVEGRHAWAEFLQTVPFTTADNQIAKSGAAIRRKFLDTIVVGQEPAYMKQLQEFKKLLRSRNLLLKKGLDSNNQSLFETINGQFVILSKQIARTRIDWMRKLSPLARLAYRRISGAQEDLQLAYLDTGQGDLMTRLAQTRTEERRLRQTLAGAQLDDLILTLDGLSVTQFASEGQQRSVALALRLAQVDLLRGLHGSWPIILLDDVMGELDEGRRNRLIELGNQGAQVLLTATEESWKIPEATEFKKFFIIKGGARL